MKTLNTILIGAVSSVLLAGCAVGPDFRRPEPPQAERYDTLSAADAMGVEVDSQRLLLGENPPAQWWQLFNSPVLDALVQRALAGNRTMTAAQWSLVQADEFVNARAGAAAPQVSMTGGVGRQKYGAQFLGPSPKPPPFTYFAIGPTVSYALDFTGGVSRSVEQQRALAEYQQHQVEAATMSVSGHAVLQAFGIASLRAQIATVESLLERDRENLQLVKLAFDAGSVSRLDVLSAESQLASDATLLPAMRQELSEAQHALAITLGTTPADDSVPALDLEQFTLPKDIPLSVPSELARRRPDILAAEAQLHAATAAVGVAQANLYPHLELSSTMGQQSITASSLFGSASNVWSMTAGLVAPLFDGGKLRAEKRAAIAAMNASAASYEQTVLNAFGQVADCLQALGHGSDQLQAQTRAEQAARATVEMTRQSYQEGNVGILQVLDAERRYQQAKLGFVRAQAQRYVDTAALMLALGGAQPRTS